MKIASFSDIHGNHPALITVLEDIEKQGVDLSVCAGDLVGYGPYPNEVIDDLRKHRVLTIQGNYDDGVGFDRDECGCAYRTSIEKETGYQSLEWTKREVTSRNKKYLQKLPNHILWDRGDSRTLLVHGSPRRINEYLYENRPVESIERMLNPLNVDTLIFGHTHLHYHRVISGVNMVNDGSVGRPNDGDTRGCYALIDTRKKFSVEFRRVIYPVEEVAEAMIEKGLPVWLADYLRNAGSPD